MDRIIIIIVRNEASQPPPLPEPVSLNAVIFKKVTDTLSFFFSFSEDDKACCFQEIFQDHILGKCVSIISADD